MATLIGIAGSIRRASWNAALLRAAAELAPAGTDLRIASIREIPLYDGDLEAEQGVPDAVTELKDLIAAADGLLIATPEYNNSMPGVLKNAIDWLTRPPKDIARVFGGKPVCLMGATPGMGGTRLGQAAWWPVLATLGTRPFLGKPIYVADASKAFDAELRLVDQKLAERIAQTIAAFAAFAGAASTGQPRP
jgi:chromate reductase, NAD(P)H dehydrogenase (quinone)